MCLHTTLNYNQFNIIGCVNVYFLCTSMCVCVCVYVGLYVCISICIFVCIFFCVSVCIHRHIHMYTNKCAVLAFWILNCYQFGFCDCFWYMFLSILVFSQLIILLWILRSPVFFYFFQTDSIIQVCYRVYQAVTALL